MSKILELDKKLFLFIYSNTEAVRPFFQKLTHISKPVFMTLYGLLIIYQVYVQNYTHFSKSILAPFCTLILCKILRKLINRKRPYLVFESLNLQKKEEASFPSNHTASSFVISFVFLLFSFKIAIFLIVFATLISVSRIIIGIHFPADVIFGFLIALTAYCVF